MTRVTRLRPAIGEQDGVNRAFQTPSGYVAGTMRLVWNGQLTVDRASETGSPTFQTDVPPGPADTLEVMYTEIGQYVTPAAPVLLNEPQTYIRLDPVAHAVQGQPNTYYVDKQTTLWGYNVSVDESLVPRIWIGVNGVDLMYTGAANMLSNPMEDLFTIVRSMSTGAEGPAPSGSRNAIQVKNPLWDSAIVWYHYVRLSRVA